MSLLNSAGKIIVFLVFVAIAMPFSMAMSDATRQGVTNAAKAYVGTQNDPLYVTEEGFVGFEGIVSNAIVEVNTQTFEIFGYSNYDLVGDSVERYTMEDSFQVAQQVYAGLPPRFRDEYQYYSFQKAYPFNYVFTWKRFVNGTMIYDDELFVRIDYSNNNLIEWKVTYSESVDIPAPQVPAVSAVAVTVPFGTPTAEPQLAVMNDTLVWLIPVESNGAVEQISVNAFTGEVGMTGDRQVDTPPVPGINMQNNMIVGALGMVIFIGLLVIYHSYRNETSKREKLRKTKYDARRQARKDMEKKS